MFNKNNNWFLFNLMKFGNSLVPAHLIDNYDIAKIEREVKRIIKLDIVIELKESTHLIKKGRYFTDSNYIARVLKNECSDINRKTNKKH